MNFKLYFATLSVIGLTLLTSAIAKDPDFIERNPEYNLISFMSRSNYIIQRNPAHSAECFDYYIPVINNIAAKYETNYKLCCNEANIARSSADDESLEIRYNLGNRTKDSCDLLSECKNKELVKEVYECYNSAGSESAQRNYAISTDASDELAEYKEVLRVIERKEDICTNETKKEYEKESQNAYAEFNSCILGNEVPKPSTTSTTTTTESTITSTTTSPPTSTTTDDPHTTESSEEIDQNDDAPLVFKDPVQEHIQKLNKLKQHLYY